MSPLSHTGIGAGAPVLEELDKLRAQAETREAKLAEVASDLEFAEDRDRRAHLRLREVEESEKRLVKQLREARAEADNIREERSRRIKLERELPEITREAEWLRCEDVLAVVNEGLRPHQEMNGVSPKFATWVGLSPYMKSFEREVGEV